MYRVDCPRQSTRYIAFRPRPDARAREAGAEGAALAGLAHDVEDAAMAHQRVLHDGEAEAGAAGFAGAAAVDAIEALGQPWQVLGRDADAGVLHFEGRAFTLDAPAQRD